MRCLPRFLHRLLFFLVPLAFLTFPTIFSVDDDWLSVEFLIVFFILLFIGFEVQHDAVVVC